MATPRLMRFVSEALTLTRGTSPETTLREAQFRLELQMRWLTGNPASTQAIAAKLGIGPASLSDLVLTCIEDGFARPIDDVDDDGRKLLAPGPLALARIHQWATLILQFTREHYPNEINLTAENVTSSLDAVDAIRRT